MPGGLVRFGLIPQRSIWANANHESYGPGQQDRPIRVGSGSLPILSASQEVLPGLGQNLPLDGEFGRGSTP